MLLLLQFALMLTGTYPRADAITGAPQKTASPSSSDQRSLSRLMRAQRQQALREAVLSNDLKRARDLIQAGTSVRLRVRPPYYTNQEYDAFAPTKKGKEPTLLMVAVAQHEHEMVDLLLSKNAPVNEIGSSLVIDSPGFDSHYIGWLENGTALHIAVMEADLPMAERLLKAGASVKIKDAHKCTPFHYAVAERDLDFVARLIQAHSDVNNPDNRGDVPLKMAAERGYQELYDALQQAGAIGNYPVRGFSPGPTPF